MVSLVRQFEPFVEADALENHCDVKQFTLICHGRTAEVPTRFEPLKLKAQNPFGFDISVRSSPLIIR
eukprot:2736186-Lingulodinium_polyedra.AAC.1